MRPPSSDLAAHQPHGVFRGGSDDEAAPANRRRASAPPLAAAITAGENLISHTLTPSAELPVGNVHSVAPAAVHPSESAGDAAGARLAALLTAHACPKAYFVSDVAALFGKSDQWVHWVLRNVPHPDGSPIEPERIGKRRRKRFTRPLIESIVVALRYRGTLTHDGACRVIASLDIAEGLVA